MTKWWMVRAGDNNELIPDWISKGVISIGWSELGNPLRFRNRDEIKENAKEVYIEYKPATRLNWASQVWKFTHDIEVGDRVVTYLKETREYLIATVTGKCKYDPNAIDEYYPNIIPVTWEDKRISRDTLSQGAKNSLGSISTVFRIDEWGKEITSSLSGNIVLIGQEDEYEDESVELAQTTEQFELQMNQIIEDIINRLDPWQMQDLVGGLLEAMGYQVKVSPKGPDGGVDILAHKDAFGFENPVIKVQVKHRKSSTGAPEVQQLLGANPTRANCIFVSTGGYTNQAKGVAQQNGVKLIDLSELAMLITKYYTNLPIATKQLVPLRMIYIPIV